MSFIQTYRLDRLYHMFLKPKDVPIEQLGEFVARMYEAGFIEVFQSREIPDGERYAETEKLTSRQHRDELFSIIQRMVRP